MRHHELTDSEMEMLKDRQAALEAPVMPNNRSQAWDIVEGARAEGRALTPEEETRVSLITHDETRAVLQAAPPQQRRQRSFLHDRRGKTIPVLSRGERLADQYRNELRDIETRAGCDSVTLVGRIIQAMMTGDQNFIPESIRNDGTIGTPGSGGYTVPSPLSSELIDLLRSKMVMQQAGSRVVPMDSKTLDFARVTAAPAGGTYAELATITPADYTFDRVQLDAKKFARSNRASRELIEDSVNYASEVPRMTVADLALDIDGQLLNGDGVGENVLGLLNDANVPETATAGLVSWDMISTLVHDVMAANAMVGAIIMSPANAAVLDIAKASTSGVYLGPSPAVADIPILVTTACPDDHIVGGDFSSYFIGQRTALTVEISLEEAFLEHGWTLKVTSRTDGVATVPAAYKIYSGVTQA